LQPAETRSEHVARIQEHHAELLERVGWVNLLREDRSIGLDEAEASPEFWAWAEENEETTDQALDELVRSLGLQAHAALAQLSLAGLTERTLLLRSRKQGDGALHA
jgi:DNA mismatch repair protein MutH